MKCSCFTLSLLLASLAGSLMIVDSAKSQTEEEARQVGTNHEPYHRYDYQYGSGYDYGYPGYGYEDHYGYYGYDDSYGQDQQSEPAADAGLSEAESAGQTTDYDYRTEYDAHYDAEMYGAQQAVDEVQSELIETDSAQDVASEETEASDEETPSEEPIDADAEEAVDEVQSELIEMDLAQDVASEETEASDEETPSEEPVDVDAEQAADEVQSELTEMDLAQDVASEETDASDEETPSEEPTDADAEEAIREDFSYDCYDYDCYDYDGFEYHSPCNGGDLAQQTQPELVEPVLPADEPLAADSLDGCLDNEDCPGEDEFVEQAVSQPATSLWHSFGQWNRRAAILTVAHTLDQVGDVLQDASQQLSRLAGHDVAESPQPEGQGSSQH